MNVDHPDCLVVWQLNVDYLRNADRAGEAGGVSFHARKSREYPHSEYSGLRLDDLTWIVLPEPSAQSLRYGWIQLLEGNDIGTPASDLVVKARININWTQEVRVEDGELRIGPDA